jgi:hypothetical protein
MRHWVSGSIPRRWTTTLPSVVALAILLQAMAAIPVTLQWSAAANLDSLLAAIPLCSGSNGDRPNPDRQTDDHHEHCLTCCQDVLGGAVLPGPLPMIMTSVFAAFRYSFGAPSLQALGRVAGYASRGPPAAG